MAILLQSLCVRLGGATGRDLAQACRDYFPPRVNFILWVLCEIAIAACDLAELLGSAIATNQRWTIDHLTIVLSILAVFLGLPQVQDDSQE